MNNLTYNNITDPSNGNIYSIFSNYGKTLLKSYIQILNQSSKPQTGGAASATNGRGDSIEDNMYKQEEIDEQSIDTSCVKTSSAIA